MTGIQTQTSLYSFKTTVMLTLAIDFDGTIVTNDYPEVGTLKPNVVETIQKLYAEGYTILINTCRTGVYEKDAIQCLKKNKIPYHAINENLPEVVMQYPAEARKLSADLYIDDRNLGGIPDDWHDIYNMITGAKSRVMERMALELANK